MFFIFQHAFAIIKIIHASYHILLTCHRNNPPETINIYFHFIDIVIHIIKLKISSDFSGRNKSVRLLGRSDSSQQTAMPTVTRVVSILKFTTFQKGDTTFYRRISRKHRFQRLADTYFQIFKDLHENSLPNITQRVICRLFATVSRIIEVVEEVRIQPLLPHFSFLYPYVKIYTAINKENDYLSTPSIYCNIISQNQAETIVLSFLVICSFSA